MADNASHTFPGAHGLQLVSLVQRWDTTAEALLEGSGLTEAQLADPRTRLSVEQLAALTRRARTLTGEPGIGFYLGLHKRLTMYGYVGFGAMSAGTVREALELVVKFVPVISTSIRMELSVHEPRATLTLEELADLGDVHDVALFSLLVGIRQLSEAMTGVEPTTMAFDLPIAKPDYFPRFAHLLPNARFDQSIARVHFQRADLERPLVTPDRAAMLLARDACERQLAELGFDTRMGPRVKRLVLSETGGTRSIEEVASSLHVSTRTLKRRLAEEGMTFTALREQERRVRALELVGQPTLSVEDIASELGYSSAGNFARAFRRWTGESPLAYRRQQADRNG